MQAGDTPRRGQSGRPDLGQLRRRHTAMGAWDNGDLPIWMTFGASEALRVADLAVPTGQLLPAVMAPVRRQETRSARCRNS
jgi:hypothetical protein